MDRNIEKTKERLIHPIDPVYDEHSKILILGSFPSVKSREVSFFYGHPQNRFWKVLARIFEEEVPETTEEKKTMLLRNHVALWDVIRECDISGSDDASIENVIVNDLSLILDHCDIQKIFVNGKMAEKMYRRYTEDIVKRECICLPSTSPANAAWSLERLYESWKVIRDESL